MACVCRAHVHNDTNELVLKVLLRLLLLLLIFLRRHLLVLVGESVGGDLVLHILVLIILLRVFRLCHRDCVCLRLLALLLALLDDFTKHERLNIKNVWELNSLVELAVYEGVHVENDALKMEYEHVGPLVEDSFPLNVDSLIACITLEALNLLSCG